MKKRELEQLKYDGTVEARVKEWISSARVHWETCQSHSGLQGNV